MSVLQADEVPFGADTMWSSTTAVYGALPYALKLLFLNLDIDHDAAYMVLRHDFGDASTAACTGLRHFQKISPQNWIATRRYVS